jgi:hypothetical protein
MISVLAYPLLASAVAGTRRWSATAPDESEV